MSLHEILSPSCIRVPLGATDKKGAIDELVDVLARADKVTDPDELKDAVWAREKARTTGIGYSLAIPHGKSPGVPDLAMAIGKPAEPLDFQAIDAKPVRLIVVFVTPQHQQDHHLAVLAAFARAIGQDVNVRRALFRAHTPAHAYELLHADESSEDFNVYLGDD